MNSNRVGYDTQYIPPEWLAAYGFSPERVVPRSLNVKHPAIQTLGEHSGVCPYAVALLDEALQRGGLRAMVLTTLCDQVRRLAETLQRISPVPVFLFNLPKTWQSPAAAKLYSSELLRLGRFLERCGGTPPDEQQLREAMLGFERQRLEAAARIVPAGVARIAVIGAPLAADQQTLIEGVGAAVVVDATEAGELAIPPPWDRRILADDPVAELCAAYFGLPHPARRPNRGFYEWLAGRLREREVQGLVLTQHVWCDVWRAEASQIKSLLPLPAVEIDLSGGAGSMQRAETRLQSFLEILA